MEKEIKKAFAWRYYYADNGSFFVNFTDWRRDYFEELPVGKSISAEQSRYFGVVGDASETIKNIGNGTLHLTRHMGEGCPSQFHKLYK